MTFDELEVGKEYTNPGAGRVARVVGKNDSQVVFQSLTGDLFWLEMWPQAGSPVKWRPYAPPPAPVVRYGYAYCSPNGRQIYGGFCGEEAAANNDKDRIGPVIKVSLPVDPDMLARVRDGAK